MAGGYYLSACVVSVSDGSIQVLSSLIVVLQQYEEVAALSVSTKSDRIGGLNGQRNVFWKGARGESWSIGGWKEDDDQ